MSVDPFQLLLEELSVVLNIPLQIDKNGGCTIKINNDLQFQLKPDPTNGKLAIVSNLGLVPPGRYRIEVLKEALKDNYEIYSQGKLSFSEGAKCLVLYETFPIRYINGAILGDFAKKFASKALAWKKAIDSGKSHP
ncbi:MAG: putative type secretion chaperone SycE [Chlamydiales bacterium]|jgi:hypothetical protein|nr:putative type secretion chaperone SycE [Chlamydiales bacterium]